MLSVSIYRLPGNNDIALPRQSTIGSAGVDIAAAIPNGETWLLSPGGRILVPTGFIIALPDGYEAQIRSRSGLSFQYGIIVLNSPGTIDSDYRGELKIILMNFGNEDFILKRGDRIAQLIVSKLIQYSWNEEDSLLSLSTTERNFRGCGSTGIR